MALTAKRTTMGFELVRNIAGFPANPVPYELTPSTAFKKGDLVVFSAGKVAQATSASVDNILGVMAETITADATAVTKGLVYDNPFNVYRVTFKDHKDGTATGGSTTTLIDTNLATSSNDVWNGALLYIYDGAGKGSVRTVSDYDGATDTLTVVDPFPEAIDTTSKYILLGSAAAAGDVINVGTAGIVLKDCRSVDANANTLDSGALVGPLVCVAIYPEDLMMDVIIKNHLFK